MYQISWMKNSWWEKVKKIISNDDGSNQISQPLFSGTLERDAKYLAAYENWKNSVQKKSRLNYIQQQMVADNCHEGVQFLNIPQSAGIIFFCKKCHLDTKEAHFLMDWWRDQILPLEYFSYLSDTRSFHRHDCIETIDRHYLKPILKEVTKPVQRFGNITIELKIRNDEATTLALKANYYQGRNYPKPRPFDELLKQLV